MITSWIAFKKPDPSLSLNGALAGLVAITAGCDVTTPVTAAIIGLAAGVIVVGSVVFFDKIRIDDPVGAVSVHGVCGAWGTLATGLFATGDGLLMGGGSAMLVSQIIGVAACFAFVFPSALVLFLAIKYTIGLRVSEEEEIEGLDILEHGLAAYPPAMVADTFPGGVAYAKMPGSPAMASSPIGHVSTEGAS
jgi:Amt family ammonium transporter